MSQQKHITNKLKMKKNFIFGMALALISIQGVFSQQAKQGRVIDDQTMNPVVGATINIKGQVSTTTNEQGYFTFNCQSGLQIEIVAAEYGTKSQSVSDCSTDFVVLAHSMRYQAIQEVQVTQNTNSKSKLEIPASIATLGLTEIKRGNGLFMDDAINGNIPGVYMQRRTVSAGQNFNIRGYGNGVRGTNGTSSNFDGQGTKVYLNGIPLTDAEGITLMDDIDFGSIGSVEVQKGPSGSLYGLAIAGVVNLTTQKAAAGKTSIGQDVMFGSYGLKRFTTTLQTATTRSSLLVNYGKQEYDGFMPHTSSTKNFVNVFGTFDVSSRQSFNYYLGYSNSYDQRNGELTKGQYDTLDYSGNTAYIKNDAHSNVVSVRTGVSHIYRFSEHFSNTSTLFATGLTSNVSSAGGWTDKLPVNYGVRSTFDYKRALGEKFHLSGITGVEAQRQYSQTIAYNMVKDSLNSLTNPDAYNIIGSLKSNTSSISTTYSYFTEWTLKMPYKISLTAGVGVSNMSIQLNDRLYVASNNSSDPTKPHKPSLYEKSYNNNVSPKIAVNKLINESLSVYTSYSVGYKAPVSSYFYIPLLGQVNPNLKPEKGTQYEVGVKGNMFNKQLTFEVAAFMTNFENKMTVVAVPNATNTATSYTYVANGGQQQNKGLELAIRYEIMKKSDGIFTSVMPFVNGAYSNFQYKDFKFQQLNSSKDQIVEVDYSGKKVAGVPPLTLNAGIDVATKYGVYANLIYSYRDSVFYTSDNVDRAPSFGLLNGKIGYRKVFAKHFSVDAYLGLNNITNQQYYVMLFVNQTPDVYIPGPNKMNFFGGASLKYTF